MAEALRDLFTKTEIQKSRLLQPTLPIMELNDTPNKGNVGVIRLIFENISSANNPNEIIARFAFHLLP